MAGITSPDMQDIAPHGDIGNGKTINQINAAKSRRHFLGMAAKLFGLGAIGATGITAVEKGIEVTTRDLDGKPWTEKEGEYLVLLDPRKNPITIRTKFTTNSDDEVKPENYSKFGITLPSEVKGRYVLGWAYNNDDYGRVAKDEHNHAFGAWIEFEGKNTQTQEPIKLFTAASSAIDEGKITTPAQ